jgi:hypothetical protein
MSKRWMVAALLGVALALAAGHGVASADWKSRAAKKAVGKAAQNGIENAVEDAVKDATFGAAMDAVTPDLDLKRNEDDRERSGDVTDQMESRDRSDRRDAVELGSSAARGIETAMDVADFAQDIDTAIDVADKAKKANKVRKIIR